jgi:hypothetical protein
MDMKKNGTSYNELTPEEIETNQSLNEMRSLIKPGDKVYYYMSSPESWENLCGRAGYILYRDEEEIYSITTMMN